MRCHAFRCESLQCSTMHYTVGCLAVPGNKVGRAGVGSPKGRWFRYSTRCDEIRSAAIRRVRCGSTPYRAVRDPWRVLQTNEASIVTAELRSCDVMYHGHKHIIQWNLLSCVHCFRMLLWATAFLSGRVRREMYCSSYFLPTFFSIDGDCAPRNYSLSLENCLRFSRLFYNRSSG